MQAVVHHAPVVVREQRQAEQCVRDARSLHALLHLVELTAKHRVEVIRVGHGEDKDVGDAGGLGGSNAVQ